MRPEKKEKGATHKLFIDVLAKGGLTAALFSGTFLLGSMLIDALHHVIHGGNQPDRLRTRGLLGLFYSRCRRGRLSILSFLNGGRLCRLGSHVHVHIARVMTEVGFGSIGIGLKGEWPE
jgi:hypothetical protein